MPAGLLEVRPVLSNGLAGALSTGETEGERHLAGRGALAGGPGDTRERTGLPGTRMVVADDEELHRLRPGSPSIVPDWR